jgi:hypothetical protein
MRIIPGRESVADRRCSRLGPEHVYKPILQEKSLFYKLKRDLLDDFLNFLQYEGFFAFVSMEAIK